MNTDSSNIVTFQAKWLLLSPGSATSPVIISRLQKTFYGVTVFKNIHNLENIWNDQWIVLYYLVIWNFPIRDHTNTYCTNFLYIHVFWLSHFKFFIFENERKFGFNFSLVVWSKVRRFTSVFTFYFYSLVFFY